MIQDLPQDERIRLVEHDFDQLWTDLHLKPADGEAYEFGKEKFNQIKPHLKNLFKRFPSRDPDGKYLWLFPKGKPDYRPMSCYNSDNSQTVLTCKENLVIDPVRLIPESPFECALREFTEETNGVVLTEGDLRFEDPVVERYLGSNSKNYQTNYFVFEVNTKFPLEQFPKAVTSIREVSIGEVDDIIWVPHSKLSEYLCPARQQLIHYIENHLPSNYPDSVSSIWKCPAELSEFQIE